MDQTTDPLNVQDFVYALAVPTGAASDRVCFAARQSGLYLSEDGCRTWRSAYASLSLEAPLATTCVALSPDFEVDRTLFAGVPGGVLISEDSGESWLSAHVPSPAPLPSALVVSPGYARDGVLLLGTAEDGVLRSTTRGSAWVAWNFGLLDFNVLSLVISPGFAEDQTVYAGTGSGLFASRSGGRSWHELHLPVGPAPVLSLALSPDGAAGGRLYVGTEDQGLFCSRDRGKTWDHLGSQVLDGAVNQVLVSPGNPDDLWVAHEDTLLRSTDGGQSWSVLLEAEIACLSAPQGFTPGKLLVGLVDGSVRWL